MGVIREEPTVGKMRALPAAGESLREGDVIAAGYDAALDELRAISSDTDSFLLELERRERERSGIANLKLGYNRVQGFFIEVTRAQADRVPADYIRRQTVKSAERLSRPSSRASRTRCSERARRRSHASARCTTRCSRS